MQSMFAFPPQLTEEDRERCADWNLPLCFVRRRHLEAIEAPAEKEQQSWRMKERMKTVSVALVLCLNVGVDPPDVLKPSPCARLECWLDPFSMSAMKAIDTIGATLQRQYERWQPRARYKQSLDPTVDDVKKLCSSMRRNAKEERVLMHYNGHGVPKPTRNGEIWVFNKAYTQYIPLSLFDLQTWIGSPSIFVWECNSAGIIVDEFTRFEQVRMDDYEKCVRMGMPMSAPMRVKDTIHLAACGADEILPLDRNMPADMFTSCLTTPIKIALRWWSVQAHSQKMVPETKLEHIDKIPGRLNDRRTPLGELNWIFTAVTDSIAWKVLPKETFQKLFRQDLLVASLFRNFLLAERILPTYKCTPISFPRLPSTRHHPMWGAWEMVMDVCLKQLPRLLDDNVTYEHSPFFAEQLTAFGVWLRHSYPSRPPPEQLPIILQVLLSPLHRFRALDLLGHFLDQGPEAVSVALSVGIFPYVVKLLQSAARELRTLLVFVWTKIVAVDPSCQTDLVKDGGFKYFLTILADPASLSYVQNELVSFVPLLRLCQHEYRTMAAFIMAAIVHNNPAGQEACLHSNLIATCLELLESVYPLLRQWAAICLGAMWKDFDAARWCGVRDSAHEKLYPLLSDPVAEVRAAVIFALANFISSQGVERNEHAAQIDQAVGLNVAMLVHDGSHLVRKELCVAFRNLVRNFESQFSQAMLQVREEDQRPQSGRKLNTSATPSLLLSTSGGAGLSGRQKGASEWVVVTPGNEDIMVAADDEVPMLSSTDRLRPRPSGSDNSPSAVPQRLSNANTSSYSSSSGSSVSSSAGISSAGTSPMPPSSLALPPLGAPGGGPVRGGITLFPSVWRAIQLLANDPHPDVASRASRIVECVMLSSNGMTRSGSVSLPSSPLSRSRSHALLFANRQPDPLDPARYKSMPRNSSLHSMPNSTADPKFATLPRQQSHNPGKGGQAVLPELPDDLPNFDSQGKEFNTGFFEWCASEFSQPISVRNIDNDPSGDVHLSRRYRFERNSEMRRESRKLLAGAGHTHRIEDQIFVNRCTDGSPTKLHFHPYESELVSADVTGVSVWNWDQGNRVSLINNGSSQNTRISTLDFINPHDISMLLVGTEDGCVRLWRNYNDPDNVKLIAAWRALTDMIPMNRTSPGLVVDWEQESGVLFASGNVKVIRVWDTQREQIIQDIPTSAESCVTSLASDVAGRSLLIAGCGDGTVRLYDRRLQPSDCLVRLLREHAGWVVKVHLQQGVSEGKIITASAAGDVRYWDPRFTESTHRINTDMHISCMDVHHSAPILALGTKLQPIVRLYSVNRSELVTNIRYHDGFMGQRIGPVNCLAFHPYKLHIAVGFSDNLISVYADDKKK